MQNYNLTEKREKGETSLQAEYRVKSQQLKSQITKMGCTVILLLFLNEDSREFQETNCLEMNKILGDYTILRL